MSLSVAEAAKLIGIPPTMLSSWVWAGSGPKPVGGRRFNNVQFEAAEVRRWLQENQTAMGSVIGASEPVWPAPVKPYQRPILRIERD